MLRSQTQFNVGDAGCLIYVTDRSVIEGTAGEGPVVGGELYQDDGFCVRVVLGELTPEEQDNWTSKLATDLQLPSGQMIVSGILDPDYDRWLVDFGVAELSFPLKAQTDPVEFDPSSLAALPRAFIEHTGPPLPSLAHSIEAAVADGFDHREIATGHDMMLADPQATAKLLLDLATAA